MDTLVLHAHDDAPPRVLPVNRRGQGALSITVNTVARSLARSRAPLHAGPVVMLVV